jgi:hypothetical protein
MKYKGKRMTAELRVVKDRDNRERRTRFYLYSIFTDWDGVVAVPNGEDVILVADTRAELVESLRAIVKGAKTAINSPVLKA